MRGTLNVTRERARGPEPVPEGDLVRAPAGLTKTQQAIWKYAIEHAPRGVLKMCDSEIMKSWVLAVDRRNELERILDEERGEIGWGLSPIHRNLDRLTLVLTRLSGEIGFSPASRPRLRTEVRNERDPDSPWAILRLAPAAGLGENLTGSR
jgi:hypothetical protein